jgi:protein-S-isoprenylcysteine O-methyltransferase Ste14
MRFLSAAPALGYIGLALTAAGCGFAIWARLTLGSNWSGRATVKAGHELIVSGPYALARHPIYTGLLVAAAGTALARGEWRCILGIALIIIAFLIKMSHEEKLMLQTFPDAYPRYRQRVKALIPGLF